MSAPSPAPVDQAKATTTDWLAVVAGSLGALLATLDSSIVNSALPTIQGEIGATGTEGTWVSTGYLLAEVIIIPLTAWLSRLMGLRTLLLGCCLFFSASSMFCGLSASLFAIVIGRIGQGIAGGALVPTAQTIIRTRLPHAQQPIGMTIFGLIVIVGPLIGPVVGGWLTQVASWRWCFFLNLPVTVLLVALLLLGLPHERMRSELVRRADWAGIAGMALTLGTLTIILEEGQRKLWFSSPLIRWLSLVFLAGVALVTYSQRRAKDPVVKLGLLLNRAYANIIIIVVAVGSSIYGISYILPQFLTGIAGYNASQSGHILLLSGVPILFLLPILPRIIGRIDLRLTVSAGLLCFGVACWVNVHLTADDTGRAFVISQLLTGIGSVLAMMPLNQAAVASVERDRAADAAGLYNMARNLGGSCGLALLGILIDRRNALHTERISETLNANSSLVQERVNALTGSFLPTTPDAGLAHQKALSLLFGQIRVQAEVMTYSDCFFVLSVMLISLIPLVLILHRPQTRKVTS